MTPKERKLVAKILAFKSWREIWSQGCKRKINCQRATADLVSCIAANIHEDKKIGEEKLNFRRTPLSKHRNLKRAENSIATKIRSKHIGLRSHLYRNKVTGVHDPKCPCGYRSQKVK